MSETSIAQMRFRGTGMAYAIRLSDGKFILVDGGMSFDKDGPYLYEYLRRRSGDEGIVIAAWLFTHGHVDHVALAARFMTEYRNSIRIERILYNIPRGEDFNGYDAGGIDGEAEDAWFRAVELYPEALLHEVRTGEVFCFSGATVEVLTSAEDRYPDPPTNRNQTSAVYKLTLESGVRFMVLGDAWGERLIQLIDPASPLYVSEDKLKCEILQVSHHGLAVASPIHYEGVRELYRRIDPSICFWPTPAERFYNDTWCQDEKYIYNRFLLDKVKERNFHQTQMVEVDGETLRISLLDE